MTKYKKKKKKNKTSVTKQKDHNAFYRIIITSQNKIMVCVFKTLYKKSAVSAFNKIIIENKKSVKFKVKYSSRDHKLMSSKYEILLMKTKTDDDPDSPLHRNEFGKLVPHTCNSNKMIIYKKEEYLFEETFWIYGLNPKSQRRDYFYILNDLIVDELTKNGQLKIKYPIKTLIVYRNKLLIENDDDFEIVICKCEEDSARLYTELQNDIKKQKIKSVAFLGFAKDNLEKRIEEKLLEKTGWALNKIRRKNTRP